MVKKIANNFFYFFRESDIVNFKIPENFLELKKHLKDPIYQNSFFILLTLVTGAIFGFIFWIIAAKLYPQEYVGINTALISAVSLIAVLSFLGLDQSIIRFFPQGNKLKILVTSTIIVTIATIFFGSIFVMGIDTWSPKLRLVKDNLIPFFVALVSYTLTTPAAQALIALRKAKYYFYQNIVMGLRIFLILIPFLGNLGIFISFGISSFIAVIFSFYYLMKLNTEEIIWKEDLKIDKDFLKDSFSFSAGNYILGLLMTIPGFLLPIMVLNVLGSNQTAYYYISYSLVYMLFMIPAAFSQSLFVEGSHGESLKRNTFKALLATFGLLIPLAFFMYLLGANILGIFGSSYVNGLGLFRMMIISSFFVAITYIYFSVKKVLKDIKDLLFISFLIFTILIGTSYPFMIEFGIVGVGYSWILSYFLASLIVIFGLKRLINHYSYF